IFNSFPTELFRVQSDGDVGIGLSSQTASSRLSIWDAGNSGAGQRLALGFSTDYGFTIGRNPTTGFLENMGSDTGYGDTYKGFTFNSKVGIGTQSNFGPTTLNALLELDPVSLPTTPIGSVLTFGGRGLLQQGPPDSTDNSQMGIMASFASSATGVGTGMIFARHTGDCEARIQFHRHPRSTPQPNLDIQP